MKLNRIKIVFLFFALVIFSNCSKSDPDGARPGVTKSASAGTVDVMEGLRPTDVKVLKIVSKDVKDVYTIPGVAEAWEVISVPTETSGPVNWIGKEEGDTVKAGEPILKINTETLTANLNSTKVQMDARRKDFIRTDNLFKQESVSQKSFDDATDALALADVNYRLALEEYNKGVVKSPISGSIDDIVPNRGEYVSPGTVVATIVSMDKLKIYVDIPEKDIPFLALGQEVDVYPADIADETQKIKGLINFISKTSNPKTLTYKARIDLDNQTLIKPGRIVRADIVRRDIKNTLAADIYSVIDNNGEKFVYLNKNGKAFAQKVDLGPMVGQEVVISAGLVEGDLVVVSGQQFLSDGAPVRVAE